MTDPLTALALLVLAALYLDGWVQETAARAGGVPTARFVGFFVGLTITALTLLSPLDGLGYRFFWAHMLQHLVLILAAAPLLAWSDANQLLRLALPEFIQRGLAHILASPSAHKWHSGPRAAWLATGALAVAIWIWHVPTVHDAALATPLLHSAEHLSVLGTAALFWRVVFTSGEHRVDPGLVAVLVSLISLQGSLLSAILMFSPVTLCRSYAGNPIEDQVLAGLLMCIPASFIYLASTLWALTRMLTQGRPHAR